LIYTKSGIVYGCCTVAIVGVPVLLSICGYGMYLREWRSFGNVPTIDAAGVRHPSANEDASRQNASPGEWFINCCCGVAILGTIVTATQWLRIKQKPSRAIIAWGLIGIVYAIALALAACEALDRQGVMIIIQTWT